MTERLTEDEIVVRQVMDLGKPPFRQTDPREAVYIFQPTESGFASIPLSGAKLRPGQTKLESAYQYIADGKPVPPSCIPASFDVQPVERNMPDFYYWRNCEIIVSSRARQLLEELAPNAIQYIEIKLNIDRRMNPADGYYYINVLPSARTIDWEASASISPTQPNMDHKVVSIGSGDRSVKFKSRGLHDPLLWHELNLDSEHLVEQGRVLMRGDLWVVLDRKFPGQLDPSFRWA